MTRLSHSRMVLLLTHPLPPFDRRHTRRTVGAGVGAKSYNGEKGWSLWVRASDCQRQCRNGPGFNASILRHSGICGPADEAVLNKLPEKNPKILHLEREKNQ
jgi:hypothetical protein